MKWTGVWVVVCACGGAVTPPAAAVDEREEVTEVAPEPLGPDVLAMADLSLALDAELAAAAAEIPGASAAVVTPLGTWLGATGVADIAQDVPMTVDTRLYLGSLSKPITAATVLALAARGALDVDAPLTDALADYRCGGESSVRVRDLLTHTAGIPREGGMEYWFTGVFPTRDELRAQLVSGALEHPPGTVWTYSNVGYAALGPLVAASGDAAFADVVRATLFEPLGMTRSAARGPVDELAVAYTAVGVDTGRGGRPFAGLGATVEGRRVRVYHDSGAMAPAFGMASTARDMSRFVAMLLGAPTPLGDAVRSPMLTLQHPFPDDPESGWTYGLRKTHDEHGALHRHVGWFAAYRSQLQLRAERGFGVVVLTNSDDGIQAAIVERLEAVLLGRF